MYLPLKNQSILRCINNSLFSRNFLEDKIIIFGLTAFLKSSSVSYSLIFHMSGNFDPERLQRKFILRCNFNFFLCPFAGNMSNFKSFGNLKFKPYISAFL